MTALCPFCKRAVAVITQAHGLRLQPSFATHGPGGDSLFCKGSGKDVSPAAKTEAAR